MKKVKKNRKQSKHVDLLPKEVELKALEVPCPRCSVYAGERCVHTKGAKRGMKCFAHEDRIKLSRVQVKLPKELLTENPTEAKAKKQFEARQKLTPEQKEIVDIILDKITVLGRHAQFVGPVAVGPIISTYRFFPLRRTKVAHIEGMAKDFAVALGDLTKAETIVVKRMPGESAVGVFVPNRIRKEVQFKDTLTNVRDFMDITPRDKHLPIPLNFGIDSVGKPFVDDLTLQPHVLIAGTTGGGKSTLEKGLVLSMLWAMAPEELRLIISDTKGVEFRRFKGIPHLQKEICTDIYQTMAAMEWLILEADIRYKKIAACDVTNIHEYNLINKEHKLPYIVLIIDELADLMGNNVDVAEAKANSQKLSTIVARSRACGIHVIAATQRSDAKLVKGSIKANFSSRLAFKLPAYQDSKTILSTKGAENLIARGDMFYQSSMSSELRRLHAPLTTLEDVTLLVGAIIARWKAVAEESLKVATPEPSDEHVWKPSIN